MRRANVLKDLEKRRIARRRLARLTQRAQRTPQEPRNRIDSVARPRSASLADSGALALVGLPQSRRQPDKKGFNVDRSKEGDERSREAKAGRRFSPGAAVRSGPPRPPAAKQAKAPGSLDQHDRAARVGDFDHQERAYSF